MLEGVRVPVALDLDMVSRSTAGARGDAGPARVDAETSTQPVVAPDRIRILLPLRHRCLMLAHEAARIRARVLVIGGGLLDADALDGGLLLVGEGGVGVEEGVEGVGVRFLI